MTSKKSLLPLIHLVDDESGILEIYQDILSQFARIETFNDPQKFIAHFDNPSNAVPDLIITDFNMPKMSGIDMVRNAFKKGVHFPVILLSGYLDKDAAIKAIDIGVYKLLEKPTDENILLASIEQILVENEIYTVQKEIQKMISQLKEYYKGFREALTHHLPQDVLKKLIVETYPDGRVKKDLNLDEELDLIEKKLESLIEAEKNLREIKKSKIGVLKA